MREGGISIWFFIGVLLFIYGVLICGTGVYELFRPMEREVVLSNLRPSIWWGGVLIAVGALYTIKFYPRKTASEEVSRTAEELESCIKK